MQPRILKAKREFHREVLAAGGGISSTEYRVINTAWGDLTRPKHRYEWSSGVMLLSD